MTIEVFPCHPLMGDSVDGDCAPLVGVKKIGGRACLLPSGGSEGLRPTGPSRLATRAKWL